MNSNKRSKNGLLTDYAALQMLAECDGSGNDEGLDVCIECTSIFFDSREDDGLMGTALQLHQQNMKKLTDYYGSLAIKDEGVQKTLQQLDRKGRRWIEAAESGSSTSCCACCFGLFSNSSLVDLKARLLSAARMEDPSLSVRIAVVVECPPIIDCMRITCRTILTGSSDKTFPFPTAAQLTQSVICAALVSEDRLHIVDVSDAQLKLVVRIEIAQQLEYCVAICPDFKVKRIRKRTFGAANHSQQQQQFINQQGDVQETVADLNQTSVDQVLIHSKSLAAGSLKPLLQRLVKYTQFASNRNAHESSLAKFSVTTETCPLYLLGRYRKLARDVPQSMWTIAASELGTIDDDDTDNYDAAAHATDAGAMAMVVTSTTLVDSSCESSSDQALKKSHSGADVVRKGRNSVEEIINEAISKFYHAQESRFHPCGREDIDVRCLGNGRPFAIEILRPMLVNPAAPLQQILHYINSDHGLNNQHDVEVPYLTVATRNTWETMQKKAEEKKKGYVCLVWTAAPVTADKLRRLEQLSMGVNSTATLDALNTQQQHQQQCGAIAGGDVDDEGVPCLTIQQKTPLRVMHRRSLLDRKRHVYSIETARINSNFFMMKLVTSAGTYVKEFVHGDFGRTRPSVHSLLQTPADILQLDVIRLYDDLHGCDGEEGITARSIAATTADDIAVDPLAVINAGSSNTSYDNSADSLSSSTSSDHCSWATLASLKIPKYN